ncbi:MAG: multicopper oxidase family protein [Candidatus Saccharibacteria bacterium]|nr:multicopper oxidase family protein [Microbacteriaceae bacterium]
MQPIDRRTALTLGGLGLLGAVVGGGGLFWQRSPSTLDALTGAALQEPEVLRSRAGFLDVRLEAASGSHEVAGRRATTLGYNGGIPGPTLRIRPGDTLRIQLINRLEEPTNLHVHGLHVSPEGNGDNVFVVVEPGDSFSYEYRLREDHSSGVYWYHPHHHGMVADQLFGGLYGAIIVEDADSLPVTRERVMVVSDISLAASGQIRVPSTMEQMMGREGSLVLVNGQATPVLEARPGDRERWRVVNACSARYLLLRLDGQRVQLLGRDSGRLALPLEAEDVMLAPGNRADLVVTARRGHSVLRAEPFDRGGMMGAMMGGGSSSRRGSPVDLATFAVRGSPRAELAPLPRQDAPRDLRASEVSGSRVLTFQMGMGGAMMGVGSQGMMSFTIDGKKFDAARVDQKVTMGAIEEWTIRNDSPMDHPFHLHVWPMQLITDNGESVETPTWLDVVNVPARGEVTVRIAFDDYGGRTVYHCHILDHEDRGMMGVVLAG